MGIVAWILIGGIAGWLASMVVEGTGLGLLGDICVGIIGAFIGGVLMTLAGDLGVLSFNILSLMMAAVGAGVALLVIRNLNSGKRLMRRTF